ncbi:unnamed protein product, partial [Nippostrongylus brasiliensis]|uniref:Integrase catalytic domain-containing protein n=1 Tax=Nippostrongylus brasiliensis TaxID=27835 RepID=A0A0N4Y8Q1_NIPBR
MPKRCFPPNPMPENYVRLDQITDDLYDKFCKEVLEDKKQQCTKQERKLLDNMSSSGDFGAAVDFYDEIMGELPVVMVHMRTSKVFLSPSLREKCIEKVIAVKKKESNPICSALAHIQQIFVGFPPEIRLRHMLVAELEKQEPGTLSEEDKRLLTLPPSARFSARSGMQLRRSSLKEGPAQPQDGASPRTTKINEKSADSKGEVLTLDPVLTPQFQRVAPKPKPMYLNLLVPLEDFFYDILAEVLAGRRSLESIADEPLRLAVENIRDSGELIVEEWEDERYFCPPGLRLRANDDVGRIHLRKSEVAEVWRMCYATLNERPQCDILSAVDAQYVGIATKAHIREVSKYDILKGSRVVFPAPPRSIGRKPMQYVQLDILVMEETVYGERAYSQALFLTDLFSGYCFARALTDCPDLAIIVRHVMDIFGSFGPPEVYRTYSLDYASVISDVMLDIERLFKIPIKNMGVGGNLTRDLVRNLYRRAEMDLMATNRWVEALPFAVIEQNHRPSKFFDSNRTPFEIMFNRHAWRDEVCPPWVNPAVPEQMELDPAPLKKIKRRYDGELETPSLDSVKDLKMYANSLVESRKRIKTQVLPIYIPVYNEEGKLVNPGTGFLYHVYDRVYVRNPNYNSDCRSSKQRTHVARYYRGIIVDIDVDLVDSMYKILYWEDDPHDIDAMSASQWPAADDTYDCASSWFGPWDVTASTGHLAKLRAVPIEYCSESTSKRRTIDIQCRCNSPTCNAFAHVKCQRKFSTECCLKSPYYCSFHKRDRFPADSHCSTFGSIGQKISPSLHTREVWSSGASSIDRADSVATTSDDAGHMQATSSAPESIHSPAPSPIPSACHEIEISPEEISHEVLAAELLNGPSEVVHSDDHSLQSSSSNQQPNGTGWEVVPEMSLTPRLATARDHPYETDGSVVRPLSPTVRSLVVNSIARRLEKSATPERRTYTARAVAPGSQSNERSPASANSGVRQSYRLVETPRCATHVHPFDAELMTEEKEGVDEEDDVNHVEIESQEEVVPTPVVISSVARRVSGFLRRIPGFCVLSSTGKKMDERSTVHKAQSADFKTADRRADFWKVRIVPQSANHTKVYLFPSLLDWLSERPQYVLGAALIKKEAELGIELPDDLIANAQKVCVSANIYGDPLTAFVGGFCDRKPSSQDLGMLSFTTHQQWVKIHRNIFEVPLAMKLSEDNNYEHDLLQLSQSQTNPDVWDDYKTSVMLRLSRGGVPSPETFEAATVTRLMCDFMAGPPARRRAAIAEMAASGLKLDAMVLARLYFHDDEIFNQLQSECAGLFEETMNFDTNEIAEEIIASTKPFFQRHFLRSADQLSCYRILRIDYALNEHAPLEKKLIGRLELARHIRYVIADALAYRNFEAIALLTEDAVMHLDKYCFFTELEQIVYITAMNLLSEAARMIFHAKPASVGWKKEKDEGDRLGLTLQQHPNGYIGGLIELWTKRDSLMEIMNSRDVYRQHSLLTSIEGIATVLREDTLLNPICRGLLIFACEFVCSALQALFGRPCQRITELAKANTCLDHHTGSVLVRRLMKKVFSSKIDENASRVLNQLCDMPIEDALVASKDGDHESRTEVHDGDRVVPIKISSVTTSPKAVRAAAKEPKTSPYKSEDAPQENNTTASCPNSDLIDTSSVAPSRSVCEQVATMMEGVKYCRERESTRVAAPDRGKAKRELVREVMF